MRIRSLCLQKYGPFDEKLVSFGQGLTVVHGPNEAGKSTLLNGLGDFLWGYSNRNHPRAFTYAAGTMRLVGAVSVGGHEHTWTRRLKKLFDSDGSEVTPPWDPEQTGSMGEWSRGFGLDLDQLQAGGRALIDGGGDLADVVFLAETGIAIEKVRADLDKRMDQIYKERANAKCAVREVLTTIDGLTAQIRDSEASAGDVAALRERRDELLVQKAELEEVQIALGRRIRRLEEFGRCFKAAAGLREVEVELQEVLDSGPTLDRVEAAQLSENLESIRTARASKQRDAMKLKGLEDSLAALELQPEVLSHAGLIKELGHRVAAVKSDRALVSDLGKQESLKSAVVNLLHDLAVEPVGEIGDEVAALRIAADEVDQLDRAAEELDGAHKDVAREQAAVRKAELALQRAEQSVGADAEDSALTDARSRRDESWRNIKGPWLSGELPDGSKRIEMAKDLDADIRGADQVAESQAEQLTVAAEIRGKLTAGEQEVARKREELAAAESLLAEAGARWDALVVERGLPRLLDPAGWSVRADVLQRLETAWRVLEGDIAARAAAQERVAAFTAEAEALRELVTEGADDPVGRVEMLGELLTEASKAEGAGNQLTKQISDLRKKLDEHENALTGAAEAVDELSKRYDEEPETLLQRSNKALELSEKQQALIQELKSSKNPESDLKELLAELAEVDEVERGAKLETLNAEVIEVKEQIGDLQTELGGLKRELDDLESREPVARLKAERVSEGEELRGLVDEYRLLRLQVEMLDRYFERAAEQTRSPVLDVAGELLAELTLGRYVGFDIVTDEDRKRIEIRRDDGDGSTTPMELAKLSEGTADQVFLALRLAGIRARQDQRKAEELPTLPVVLDDVLTSHDDQRSAAALDVLAELAADFQIILLTHHRRVLDSSAAIRGITTVELAPAGAAT